MAEDLTISEHDIELFDVSVSCATTSCCPGVMPLITSHSSSDCVMEKIPPPPFLFQLIENSPSGDAGIVAMVPKVPHVHRATLCTLPDSGFPVVGLRFVNVVPSTVARTQRVRAGVDVPSSPPQENFVTRQ